MGRWPLSQGIYRGKPARKGCHDCGAVPACWQLGPETHRWCLPCAMRHLDRFLQPPYVRGSWCALERAEWERANIGPEAAVA